MSQGDMRKAAAAMNRRVLDVALEGLKLVSRWTATVRELVSFVGTMHGE